MSFLRGWSSVKILAYLDLPALIVEVCIVSSGRHLVIDVPIRLPTMICSPFQPFILSPFIGDRHVGIKPRRHTASSGSDHY